MYVRICERGREKYWGVLVFWKSNKLNGNLLAFNDKFLDKERVGRPCIIHVI